MRKEDGPEFSSQFERLKEKFGPNSYSREDMKKVWFSCVEWSIEEFSRRVNELLQWETTPTLDAFTKKPSPKVVRKFCCDGGIVMARHKETKAEYAFRCTCMFGQTKDQSIGVWREQKDFERTN